MKIVNNGYIPIVEFFELAPGDTFMDEGLCYLRTTSSTICNAVELSSGQLRKFDDSKYVTKIRAQVEIL